MCGRYALYSATETIAAAMGFLDHAGNTEPSFNIAPGTHPPNLTRRGEDAFIEQVLWGFKPRWAKADAPRPINARAEKVAESPYFRQAFARQRCLVPANGWFEWKRDGNAKLPHYLTHRDGELLFFAGIYEVDEDGKASSFAIITHPAADPFKLIHDRMPLVLKPECREAWLDPSHHDRAAIKKAVKPIDPDLLHAYPVSSAVNKPANDHPGLIESVAPLDDKGLQNGR